MVVSATKQQIIRAAVLFTLIAVLFMGAALVLVLEESIQLPAFRFSESPPLPTIEPSDPMVPDGYALI